MSRANSTTPVAAGKPKKPSDSPLTPHPTGRWCKKIKGKLHYFGRWGDHDGAMAEYKAFLTGAVVNALQPALHPAETVVSTSPPPAETVWTAPRPSVKPTVQSDPPADFPLTRHATGYWCKKIRGKTYYFGKLDDPDAALDKYLKEKGDLEAGRMPREDTGAITVKYVCNEFLNAKKDSQDKGELSPLTWTSYKRICVMIVSEFGKHRLVADLRPDDFARLRNAAPETWGPHYMAKLIQITRSVFKYAYDAELIDRPMRFGPGFKRPSQKTMRLNRKKHGPKLFTREEILQLLDAANPTLKAMILLGVNCGFGNADCGKLPLADVDLEKGIVDNARPKTGVDRRAPLWPETVTAIKESLAKRPTPKDPAAAELVFITKYGFSWTKEIDDSPITKELAKLLKKLRINGRRNFYTLRHVFRTVADEVKDQPSADLIMGHEPPHMAKHYRETISNDRLKAVTDHVRNWLFGDNEGAERIDVLPMAKAN